MEKIVLNQLSIGYGSEVLAKDISTTIEPGDVIALIGENGKGKTTLLHTILGMEKPISGQCLINNTPIAHLQLSEKAKKLSVVLSRKIDLQQFTVFELVGLGRTPYTSWSGKLTSEDISIVEKAISTVGLEHLSNRSITALSDGERQRAMIAKALAQDTPFIFLDEPTAHLDLNNRVGLLHLLRKLAQEQQKAILFSTHELELAFQMADQLWVIGPDKKLVQGCPEQLAIEGEINRVFDNPNIHFISSQGRFHFEQTTKLSIQLSCPEKWRVLLVNALGKINYRISDQAQLHFNIGDNLQVRLSGEGVPEKEYPSLGEALRNLKSHSEGTNRA